MDFAEEKLGCSAIVLCMRNDRNDSKELVRTFLILGFELLNPRSPLAPKPIDDSNLFLVYKIKE